MIYEKSCGAVVYTNVNGTRLYLVEQMLGGHWGVPKGHVEKSESEAETALREIKEEVGLDVVIDTSFRKVITYSPKAGHNKDVVFFVAFSKSTETKMQLEEIKDVKWVSLDNALALIKFQDMQEVLIHADTYLSEQSL